VVVVLTVRSISDVTVMRHTFGQSPRSHSSEIERQLLRHPVTTTIAHDARRLLTPGRWRLAGRVGRAPLTIASALTWRSVADALRDADLGKPPSVAPDLPIGVRSGHS